MDSVTSLGRARYFNYLAPAILLCELVLVCGCAPKRIGPRAVASALPAQTVSEPQDIGPQGPVGGVPAESGMESAPGFTPLLPEPPILGRSGRDNLNPGPEQDPVAGLGQLPEGARLGAAAAALAKKQLGKQYQWGAAGPDKFDCSGLVMYVYRHLGVSLPRVSGQQASSGVHVDRKDLQPGDLVFFVLSGSQINHVGIYVGSGRFVHAPRRYSPVRTDSLNDSWWSRRYRGARRLQ